jgi:hypothetical protein
VADNTTTGTTGVTIATKDRASVHFQQYVLAGCAQASTGVYAVTTTPTALVAANGGRRSILLQNSSSSVRVRTGLSSGMVAANSTWIEPGDSFESFYTGAIYLAADSGTVSVVYWEESN